MRLAWMDTLRGLAIVLVVVFHADLVLSGATNQHVPVVHAVCEALGPARMPLLMFLSGMLLTQSLAKPPQRYLRGKLTHIAWPYVVWSSINLGQMKVQAVVQGHEMGWDWVWRLFYDPPTYHWFLAYLMVYYVLALGLPAVARTLLMPATLVASQVVPPDAEKLVWLFGWFLAGDVLTRSGVDLSLPSVAWLSAIGRHSLTYYVTHLSVMLLTFDAQLAVGITAPLTLFSVSVGVTMSVGWLFVRLRHRRGVDALFVWPSSAPVRAPAPVPVK